MATSSLPLPLISVVVPSYNQAPFLAQALDSIFRQHYPRLEVVVMDGGSRDDSVAIIRSYAERLKYWQSQPDGGQSAAINAGMRHCSGDLVAWLNSDDYYWGDALWTVARAFLAHPGHGLYIGNGLRFDQRSGEHIPFIDRHIAFNREALLYGPDYVLQPSAFFLRQAWEAVGGLDPQLQFCMDWDIFLRIARRHAVVLINEFLGVSREYEETKTRSGKLKRGFEIARMVQSHTGQELTPGSLIYLLEMLHTLISGSVLGEVRSQLGQALGVTCQHLGATFGGGHWTPENSDPQDATYLPLAGRDSPLAPAPDDLPSISVVTPSFGSHPYLQETVQSALDQHYPRLEVMIVETSFSKRPPALVDRHPDRVTWCRAKPGCEAVCALSVGLSRASGEVIGWLHPGDLLTAGALRAVGRAFAEDPELGLVYANAAYLDEGGQPCLADHGVFRSNFCHGVWKEEENEDKEFPLIYTVPQPTVFFRRRLLEEHGLPDESFRQIYDYDLFLRFAQTTKVRKIERTQALCRLPEKDPPERWNALLVELYRHGRRHWPGPLSPGYWSVMRDFVRNYMVRKFRGHRPGWRTWLSEWTVQLAAMTRLANPERWWAKQFPIPNGLHG